MLPVAVVYLNFPATIRFPHTQDAVFQQAHAHRMEAICRAVKSGVLRKTQTRRGQGCNFSPPTERLSTYHSGPKGSLRIWDMEWNTYEMDVSKNRGKNPPKWMVYFMVPNPIKMDDLEVPLFLETPKWTIDF